ncbi:hypothetical protein SCHPADRAFT_286338 [Schizopora paradoxa]|uniref:RING-type domain-containing protein n=1 Tax=Schizopora paradoxa TaxID=27342 RepID=A0A0H2RT01_9AGAM|nr:hypothetical protein SCHPADRAFT_286338 [Schizopora paradoxa]
MSDLNPLAQIRASDLNAARRFLHELPSLKPEDVPEDEYCPVCFLTFKSLIEEQKELESKQEGTSNTAQSSEPPASAGDLVGIVKLTGCGHIFCRRDISEWVESLHGSCPTCRNVFFQFTPVNEADYESSDGGEYVPGEDIDEEELEDDDDDMFTEDGIPSSDADFDLSGYNAENMPDSIMDDSNDVEESDSSMSTNVGLTDGEDTVSSEYASSEFGDLDDDAYAGDVSMFSEAEDDNDIVSNQGDTEPKATLLRATEDDSQPIL